MNIWKPPGIDEEPRTKLTHWQAYLVKGGFGPEGGDTIHFCGWTGWTGRVCSAVQSYDKESHCGITQSGRIYELSGEPCFNIDALYVWYCWLANANNPETVNISDQYV